MAERDNFPWYAFEFGVVWGPLIVTRTMSDQKYGVWVTLHGRDQAIEVRLSPKGRKLWAGEVRATYPGERERWEKEFGDGYPNLYGPG